MLYAAIYKSEKRTPGAAGRGDLSVFNILRKNLTNEGDLCHNIPHHNAKQTVILEGKKMKKQNNIGLIAKFLAGGALVAAALGMHKDADAQCTGTGCTAPTNSSAAQSLANGGNSKTNVLALPGGGVSAAGLPGSGDFYGALVNSCLRSFGIGALSIGYSNASVGRYDTSTDENGNQIPGEVQQCIDKAIKQHNAGILMGSSDPTKAYLGIKAAAFQDPVLSGALTDAQERSGACTDGELNAVGVCKKTKPATAEAAVPVAAAAVDTQQQVCIPREEGTDMTRCLKYTYKTATSSCGTEYKKKVCEVWQKGTFTPAAAP